MRRNARTPNPADIPITNWVEGRVGPGEGGEVWVLEAVVEEVEEVVELRPELLVVVVLVEEVEEAVELRPELLVVVVLVEETGSEAAVAVWIKLLTPMIVKACPLDTEKVPSPFWQLQFPLL